MELEQIVQEALDKGAQQKKSELINLCKLFPKGKDLSMIELGSYSGGTLRVWKHFFNKIIAVDLEHKNQLQGVDYLTGDTIDCYNQLGDYLSDKVDFLFIDADHTYGGVKQDFEIYEPLVKKGGIIAFHDILDSKLHDELNCHVHKFWNEIKGDYKHFEFIEKNDWGGIGVIIKN